MHIALGIDMDQEAYQRDNDQHHRIERIDLKADADDVIPDF